MKSFKIKILENGTYHFLDKNDERVLQTLLSSLYKNNIRKIEMSFNQVENDISEKQSNLFKVLVNLIKKETGQDEKSIEESLVKNYDKNRIFVSQIKKEEFTDFLESCFQFAQEFFSININIDSNGHLKIY